MVAFESCSIGVILPVYSTFKAIETNNITGLQDLTVDYLKIFLINAPAAVVAVGLFFFLDNITRFEITYLLEVGLKLFLCPLGSSIVLKKHAVLISQDTACAYIASQSTGSQIKFKDVNQIDEDDIEEMDIKWNMHLLSMRADKFWKKTGKKISIQGSDVAEFDKLKVECFNCHKI
nr:PGR5-like protein 1A, chloroplastic [Tanacetum cinerariifolium]